MAFNPLQKSIRMSFRALQKVAGKTIQITRGATTVSVVAVPLSVQLTLPVTEGVYEEVSARTWQLLKDDLGALDEPRRNDTIVEEGRTYELLPVASQGCYEYQGPGFDILVLYGKEKL